MKPDDDREPIEVLYDIEKKIERVNDDPISALEPRIDPGPESNRYKLLEYISDNEPVSSGECESIAGESTTRALTTLYYNFAVDREMKNGSYEYTITPLGEKVLDGGQSTLSESDTGTDQDSDPWDGTPATKTTYYAIKCVAEADDAPRSVDITDEFERQSGSTIQDSSTPAVSPYLTAAYKKGLVDRTPSQPYRYWLTEKGKDVLNDD